MALGTQQTAAQAEKDLLADGRELLERLCGTTRYRHLFPGGPNLALLLEAYQELSRRRTVERETTRRPWRTRRRLARSLRARVRRDALDRDRRLHWHLPLPRPQRLSDRLPLVVRQALREVDYDVRDEVARAVAGDEHPVVLPDASASDTRVAARLDRGLAQLRDALVNATLADPSTIPTLHRQHIAFCQSPQPTRRRHPIATLVLVKLPIQLLMLLWIAFSSAYVGAYFLFNHETLGRFLTATLDPILDGRLEFESVEWNPWLIWDLARGQPHHIHARGVRVWEPFKSLGREPEREAAYAEHLEFGLTLHEIIPWNRLGVPAVFEIPWILHFTDVRNHGELTVEAREYTPEGTDRRVVGLLAAFMEPEETPSVLGYRRLSVRVDGSTLQDGRVNLDMRAFSGWGADLTFTELHGDLDFVGWFPEDGTPDVLPLRWSVDGEGGDGRIALLGEELEVHDLVAADLGSGVRLTPLGDMRIRGQGDVGGSPLEFDGFLRAIHGGEGSVSYRITTVDLEHVAQVFLHEQDDPRPALMAQGSPASLTIEGPLDDPSLRAVAQGITLDLFPEPAWAMEDVDVSLVLTRDPVPEMWSAELPGAGGDLERWIVYLETFRGIALDGSMRLHGREQLDHIVLAEADDEPLLVSTHLDLRGIDPGKLAPGDDDLRAMLTGAATGSAQVHKLVLEDGGTGDLARLHFFLHRAHLVRSAGPADDGLPRSLRFDGDVLYDAQEGLDVRGLSLATDGGHLSASGGLDRTWKYLDPSSLAVRIDDGAAFARALGLQPSFDRLLADLSLAGPVGAPSGREGSLSVTGVGSGGLALTGVSDARLWIERGVLHLRSPNAGLLGGHGPLELDVVLFKNGRLLSDPRVRLFLDLRGVEQRGIMGTPIDAQGAELRLHVDDGSGNPVPISQLRARGAAYAETLRIAGEPYRDANASFVVDPEGVRIDRLTVAYHRPVSPQRDPGVTVEVGSLDARGTIGLEEDPALDVTISARGLPLGALTSFTGDDLPIRGQIAPGTEIALRGTASRPEITGHLELTALNAFDVPLGQGGLDFSTGDVTPASGATYRRVDVKGTLGGPERPGSAARLQWTIDGAVAFGGAEPRRDAWVEADIGARFASLPIRDLFAHPDRWELRDAVEGQLSGLSIRGRHCPGPEGLLDACRASARGEPATRVDVDLAHLWLEPTRRTPAGGERVAAATGDPCLRADALCSASELHARLDGDQLTLVEPWSLRSGGKDAAILRVDGSFDLSSPPAPEETTACEAGAAGRPPPGAGAAKIAGLIDLGAFTALLRPWDLQAPDGRLEADVDLTGLVASPTIRGHVRLPPGAHAITVDLGGDDGGEPIPVAIGELDVELRDSRILVAGAARVFAETVRFGTSDGARSQLELSGPCRGRYVLAADGTLDGALVHALVGDAVERSSGSVNLARLHATGDLAAWSEDGGAGSVIDTLSGELGFRGRALHLSLPYDALAIAQGEVEFRRCTPERPCPGSPDGAYAIFMGGERGAGAHSRPGAALQMAVGERGHASLWGRLVLGPELEAILAADVRSTLDQVPYTQTDNAGSPELVGTLSSRDIAFERDETGTMRVRGQILVERSRWLRDAQQGVAILSFADPVTSPPEPWPEALRDLHLELQLQTTGPFRVDNNVLKKLEAEGELMLQGTLAAPELTGTISVDRGELDLDILGELYEIEGGKVRIDRELSNSFVDILAIGKEPKKINEQLHYITLHLRGPLDEITWECAALGDTSNALGTTRGCVDYLIFDAGNVDVTEQDVRRLGGTGLLYAGRPLTLVGKLTELELNEYLENEIPRLERYLPHSTVRLGQMGVETEIETRPEWLDWGWGELEFGFSYLRGYPGSLVRDTRNFTGRLQILDHTAVEVSTGSRNYTNRVLILDPANYSRLELLQNWQIPSAR
jgi:hypothetical protein